MEVMVKLNTQTGKARLEDGKGKQERLGVCLSAFLSV